MTSRPISISPDQFLFTEEGEYIWTPERLAVAWDKAYEKFADLLGSTGLRPALTIGIPGSGKTTWIEFLQRICERECGVPASHRSDEWVWEDYLFFDATLCTRTMRRPLLEIAQSLDKQIEAVVFEVPFITALRRNALREADRRVPMPTMIRWLEGLEKEPPTLAEGFWRITAIDGTR